MLSSNSNSNSNSISGNGKANENKTTPTKVIQIAASSPSSSTTSTSKVKANKKTKPPESESELNSPLHQAMQIAGIKQHPTMKFSEKKKHIEDDVGGDGDGDGSAETGLPYLGPIRLIHWKDFAAYGEIPRYPECNNKGINDNSKNSSSSISSSSSSSSNVPIVFNIHSYEECMLHQFDRNHSFIVFISHCWLAGWDGREHGHGIGENWHDSQSQSQITNANTNTVKNKIISAEHAHNWRGFPHPDNISNDKHVLIVEGVKTLWDTMAKSM